MKIIVKPPPPFQLAIGYNITGFHKDDLLTYFLFCLSFSYIIKCSPIFKNKTIVRGLPNYYLQLFLFSFLVILAFE